MSAALDPLRIARELGDRPMVSKLLRERTLSGPRTFHEPYVANEIRVAWSRGFVVGAIGGFIVGILAIALPAIILAWWWQR